MEQNCAIYFLKDKKTETPLQYWEHLKLVIRHPLLHYSVHYATLELDADDNLEDQEVY